MIRSMTGFAAVTREADGARASVTIKCVNHRFLDIALKAPQVLAGFEAGAKMLVAPRISRGRVEIAITLDLEAAVARDVVLDEALLERLGAAVDRARERGLVSGTLTASDLIRLPQVIEIRARADTMPGGIPDAAARLVEAALGDALDAVVVMRETEGRFLAADFDARIATLVTAVETIEREARAGQAALETRLRSRIAELPVALQPDPMALAQEIVRFVSRSDIDEELVRFRGHVDHWRRLASGAEPCGRKLDFLVQEMNREINTMGSKAEGTRAPEIVIGAKAELERLKEQVQNVE